MSLTKEEAETQLHKAIIDHAVAFDIANPETEILNHFAIIAHWQKVEDSDSSRYTNQYHSETMPYHVGKGLYSTAVDLLRSE